MKSLRAFVIIFGSLFLANSVGAGVLPDYGLFSIGGAEKNSPKAIATDSNGDLYVAGAFEGTMDVDPGPGTLEVSTKQIEQGYLLKLDPDGELIWHHVFNNTGRAIIETLTVDGDGNLLAGGYFVGTVDFEPGDGSTIEVTDFTGGDAFLLKLNGDGDIRWIRTFDGAGSMCIALTTDDSDAVYSAGRFVGGVDFDPGPDVFQVDAQALFDTFVVKLNQDGELQWAGSFSGNGFELPTDIALDRAGSVYTTGYFQGLTDFDPGTGIMARQSLGLSADLYIAKLDWEGNFQWVDTLGNTGTEIAYSVVIDANDYPYVVGQFSGIMDFDPGAGVHNLNAAGQSDAFVMKLNCAGQLQWAHSMGGAASDLAYDVALGKQNRLFITGYFEDVATFDLASGNAELTSRGERDAFVSAHARNGELAWVRALGSTGMDLGYRIVTSGTSYIHVIGDFEQELAFGPEFTDLSVEAAGYTDLFVARIPANDTDLIKGEGVGEQNPGSCGTNPIHTADQNGDNRVDLSEILRVIQFFNAGVFSCADPPESTEDGYQPSPGNESCPPHASDYNPRDFEVSLSELLRLVQFLNSDGYADCPGVVPPTEDGYCPGGG